MKIIYLSLIFLLSISSTYGQNEIYDNKIIAASIMAEQFFEQYGITEADLRNIEGSPYQNEYFQNGAIFNAEGVVASGVPMRYNIFSDEIEMRSSLNEDNTDIQSLVKSPDYFAVIGSDNFVYLENTQSAEKSGYFNVLLDGEFFDLYKKTTITYIEQRFAETTYQRDQPAKFIRKNIYYLVDTRGNFYELPESNTRNFVKVFKEKEKDLEQFIKKNRLDVKAEEDMIKITEHYNSIL